MAFANGHTMAFEYNLDHLGVLYLIIAGLWTAILMTGVFLLLHNRHLPYIRIRNVPLVVAAVCTLHVYWVLCLAAYVLNGFFPCWTEFWIMSIYLPLGVALFHASNTQLLYVAGLQKKYTAFDASVTEKQDANQVRGWRSGVQQFQSFSTYKKTMTYISVAMVLQLVFSFFIFISARQFHPSFGLYGHEVDMGTCRKGWEWLPSIGWQFFWAWVYAPYLLWKVRGIHDVNNWRIQTVVCVIASLPASPLWLNALYNPGMLPVDFYFVAPMWFTPSIFLMQACAIFMPLYQIYRTRKLRAETLQIIEEWQDKQNPEGSFGSDSTRVAGRSRMSAKSSKSMASSRGEMFTMNALDKALQSNAAPLLKFAAQQDFSGENISFLSHVREWKANWQLNHVPSALGTRRQSRLVIEDVVSLRRKQFSIAVSIYSSFVNHLSATFPINISSGLFKELEAMFETAAALIQNQSSTNAIAPFEDLEYASSPPPSSHGSKKDDFSVSATEVGSFDTASFPAEGYYNHFVNINMSDLANQLPPDVLIPDSFGPEIFDNAEASIKELVLTNTWAKFVKGGLAKQVDQRQVFTDVRERVGGFARRCVHGMKQLGRIRVYMKEGERLAEA